MKMGICRNNCFICSFWAWYWSHCINLSRYAYLANKFDLSLWIYAFLLTIMYCFSFYLQNVKTCCFHAYKNINCKIVINWRYGAWCKGGHPVSKHIFLYNIVVLVSLFLGTNFLPLFSVVNYLQLWFLSEKFYFF